MDCTQVITLLYLLTLQLHNIMALPVFDFCSRLPLKGGPDKTPGDNGYRIRIEGPELPGIYTPQNVYTVTIDSTLANVTFLGFMLVCVPQFAKDDSVSLGTLQLMSPLRRDYVTARRCPDVMTELLTSHRTSASVLWTAPPTGTGCLEFRATVIYTDDIWFKDEGALVKTLCEKENKESLKVIEDTNTEDRENEIDITTL